MKPLRRTSRRAALASPWGLALIGLLLTTSASLAGPPDLPDLGSGLPGEGQPSPVRARFIAEEKAIEPGGTRLVGLHLHHDEGWHTYWRNGGDSGLPTTIEWELPEGWQASEILWPTPERKIEPGDLITYGYGHDVVLFTRITAPENASGRVQLKAEVEWLMCLELCIPGGDELTLTLAVGEAGAKGTDRDRELMEASWARVPVREVEGLTLRGALDASALPPGQIAHAAVVVEGLEDPSQVEWTWFPLAVDDLFPERENGMVDGDRLLVALPFELTASAEPGTILPWGGTLHLRHPDRREDFVHVDVPVPVAAEGATIEARNEALFSTLLGVPAGNGGGLFDQDFAATGGPQRSLLYYLLLALVGGVILNVMPCVLPVLSLKVMGFVSHAGEDRGVQFRLGLTFAAGVLASFLTLAAVVIALQAAGDQLGWGFQFQNPVFVVVMAAVVFAFGLSLFGVYEIVLPVQIGAGGGKTGAYAESFLNGILATALATPCTAPFLGTALGFAFTQPAAAILAIFVAIGAGLSLPYVLLSLNPAWLRFVPKPGAWMDRFKQGMGFLLMATLIWLLWVLGQQVGLQGVLWTMAFLLTLAFALWLYGAMLNLSSSTGRRIAVWAVMIALVAVGWNRFLGDALSPEAVAAHAAGNVGGHSDGDIEWRPFDVAALEAEVAAGNTVFLDFTAAWCTTCKVNEKTVLASDDVQQRLLENEVVTFIGDWTNRDPVITQVLRQFGRSGVPFYAVFPAHRLDAPIVLPEVITTSIVLDALEKAGPSRPRPSR